MGIVEIIKAALWKDKEYGMNQSEIARKYNLSQQTINRIFHGKIDIAKLEIRTFIRMFPRAELILHAAIDGNSPDTVYPLADNPIQAIAEDLEQAIPTRLSYMDRAMLEEWHKLDRPAQCKVMVLLDQLLQEKKSISETGSSA